MGVWLDKKACGSKVSFSCAWYSHRSWKNVQLSTATSVAYARPASYLPSLERTARTMELLVLG